MLSAQCFTVTLAVSCIHLLCVLFDVARKMVAHDCISLATIAYQAEEPAEEPKRAGGSNVSTDCVGDKLPLKYHISALKLEHSAVLSISFHGALVFALLWCLPV